LVSSEKCFPVLFSIVEEMMTSWMYRFLIVGLAFFSVTPVTQPDKDDQSDVLHVHIRDYCDPVTFAALGCVRTATPVSAGVITLPGFRRNSVPINPSARSASFPIEPRRNKPKMLEAGT